MATKATSFMDSAEYKSLLRRRDNLKLELFSHMRFVNDFTESTLACQVVDIRLRQVQTSINQFEDVQSKIESLDDRDDDSQAKQRIEFNELACNVQASLMVLSSDAKKQSSKAEIVNVNDTMRLPSVPAPIFDGNLQNWPALRTHLMLCSTIINH